MRDGVTIACDIVAEGERIAREKNGKALTPDEATTVRAGTFLRQIAPYLFEPDKPKP